MEYPTSQPNVAYSTSDFPLTLIEEAVDESEYIVVRQDNSVTLDPGEYVITHPGTGHPSIRFNANSEYSGKQFRVSRITNLEQLRNTFYPGANLRAQDLNSNFHQSLQATQEVYESYLSRYGGEIEGNLTFNQLVGGRMTGLGDPIVDDEAANKHYADGVRALVAEDREATLGFKNDAEAARDEAYSTRDFLNGVYLGAFDSVIDPEFYNSLTGKYFNPHTNTDLGENDTGAFYFNLGDKISYVWQGTEFVEAIQPPLSPFNHYYHDALPYTDSHILTAVDNNITTYYPSISLDNALATNVVYNQVFPEALSKVLVEIDGKLAPPGAVAFLPEDAPTKIVINLRDASGNGPSTFPSGVGAWETGDGFDAGYTETLPSSMISSLISGNASINLVLFGQTIFGAAGWQEATFSNGQISLISRTNPELNLITDDLRPTLTTNGAVHATTTLLSNAGVTFGPVSLNSNEYVANFTIPYAKPDSFSVDPVTFEPTLGFSDGTTVTANQSILGPIPTLFNGSSGFTVSDATTAPSASLTQRPAPNNDEYDFNVVFPNVNLDSSNVTTLEPVDSVAASLSYSTTTNQYELSLQIPRGHTPTFQTGTTTVENTNNSPGISFSSAGLGQAGEPVYNIDAVVPHINIGATPNVTTLNPGSAASASVAQDANFATNRTFNLSLGIPKGDIPVLSAGTATLDSGNSFGATVGGTTANPTVNITLPRPVVFWDNYTTPPTGADHQLGVNTTNGQIFTWSNNAWVQQHDPTIPFTWKGRKQDYTDLPSLTSADKGETWTVNNPVTTITPNAPANTTFYWDGSAWSDLGNLVGADGAQGERGFKVIPIVAYADGSGTGIRRELNFGSGGCYRHEKVFVNGEPFDLIEGDMGIAFGSGEVYRFENIDGRATILDSNGNSQTNINYGKNEGGTRRYDFNTFTGTYFGNATVPAEGSTGCNYSEFTPHWVKIGTIDTGMVFGSLGETAPVVSNPQSDDEAKAFPVSNSGETIAENGVFVQYDGYGVTYKKLVRSSSYGNYVTSGWTWWFQWQDINGTHWTGRGSIGIGATLPAIQTVTNTDDTAPTNYNLGSLFILTSGSTGTFYNLGTYTHANGHTAYQWVSTGTSMNLGGGLPSTAGIVKTDGTTASTINTDGIVSIKNGTVSTNTVSGLVNMNNTTGALSGITFPSAGIVTSDGSSFSNITNNASNWDSAHGWGNHASVGYYKDGSSFADYAEGRTVDLTAANNTTNKTLTNATPLYVYTLGGNITFTLSLNAGESIQLALFLNGYTPTFSGVTWVGGGAPSALNTSNTVTHVFEFWNATGSTFGAYVGAVY